MRISEHWMLHNTMRPPCRFFEFPAAVLRYFQGPFLYSYTTIQAIVMRLSRSGFSIEVWLKENDVYLEFIELFCDHHDENVIAIHFPENKSIRFIFDRVLQNSASCLLIKILKIEPTLCEIENHLKEVIFDGLAKIPRMLGVSREDFASRDEAPLLTP